MLFIGCYKSVAYQTVSTTLSEGCGSGFVHWVTSTAKNIHLGIKTQTLGSGFGTHVTTLNYQALDYQALVW